MKVGLRRVATLIGALLGATLLFSSPVAAAKGAGLFPAGTYHLSFAGADLSEFTGNVSVFLDVSAGTDVARPDGAPQSTTSQTQVFLNVFDNSTFTFTSACVILDHPSDFTIDNRLGSASLNTTLTPSTPSCGFTPPLTSNIGIDATWAGAGPLATQTGTSNYACAGYRANSSGRSLTNTAIANATITIDGAATAIPSVQTSLNSNDFQVAAQGAIDPGCGPTGFGTGPTPSGHLHFNGLFANGFFTPPTGEFDQVSLSEVSQSGGPAANVSEDDLSLQFFGGAIDGFGCFAIPSSDVVSSGLTFASLQTTVTGSSPLCTNSFPGFNLNFPLTVSATWTGTGPVMTVHDQNNYQCSGYTQATSTFVEDRGADSVATVTMPDYLGNPQTVVFSGGFGSLTQVTQNVQANGVLAQSCLIRG